MKWLNRLGAAAGLLILAGFPIYYFTYPGLEKADYQALRSRIPGHGSQADFTRWLQDQVKASGKRSSQGPGGGVVVCLSQPRLRALLQKQGARVESKDPMGILDRFSWDSGLNRFWVMIRYDRNPAPVYCVPDSQTTYSPLSSDVIGAGHTTTGFTFNLLTAFWMITLLIFGFRLRQYLIHHPDHALLVRLRGRKPTRPPRPGSEIGEKVWERVRIFTPLLMICVMVYCLLWQMELFHSYFQLYQCRLARWRVESACNRYREYVGEADPQWLLQNLAAAHSRFQEKCRPRCAKYGPLAGACLIFECRFPGADTSFFKPPGCWYYGDRQRGGVWCTEHPEE